MLFPCCSIGCFWLLLRAVASSVSAGRRRPMTLIPIVFQRHPRWVCSAAPAVSCQPLSTCTRKGGVSPADAASPRVVFCLPSHCRPALAQGHPEKVHTQWASATPSSTQSESQLGEGVPFSYSPSALGHSLEFSLLLSR